MRQVYDYWQDQPDSCPNREQVVQGSHPTRPNSGKRQRNPEVVRVQSVQTGSRFTWETGVSSTLDNLPIRICISKLVGKKQTHGHRSQSSCKTGARISVPKSDDQARCQVGGV